MTDHHQTMQEPTEGELFRLLVENVTDYAIFVVDPQGRVRNWNPGAERLLGYSGAEILGQPFSSIFTSEDIHKGLPEQELRRAEDAGRAEGERWHVRKGGERFWASGIVTPTRNASGMLTGFSQILRDMSEQKRAKMELQAADARFAAVLVENSTDFISMCDMRLIPFFVNRAGLRLVGLDTLDRARRTRVLEFFFPEDQAFISEEFLPRVLRDGHGEVEIRFRHFETGEAIWVEYSVLALTDATGDRVGLATISRDITERRHTDGQVRFQAHLLDAVGQSVIATAPDGTILYWNRFAETLYGRTRGETVGRNIMEVLVPQASAAQGAEIMSRLRCGESWSGEFLVQRRDGTIFPIQTTNTPVLDGKGGLQAIVGVSSDITERKRIEDVLRESEERFRASFDQAAVGVAHVGLDNQTIWANPGLCRMFGYTEAEMRERTVIDLTHPDDIEADLALRQRVLAGEIPSYRIEKRFLHENGSVVCGDLAVSLVRDAAGSPKYLVGVVVDITDRKQAEDALRHSETRFRQLADALPQIVWITRPDGYHEYYNRRWYDYTGMTGEQSIGFGWNLPLHPDDRQRSIDRWDLACRTGEPYEIEYRFRAVDGAFHWFLGRALPIRDAEGQVTRWFGTCTDIEDYKRMEEGLRQAHAQLERRVAERTEALAESEKALREQTRLLQSILNSIGEGVIVADHRGRFLYFNPAAERVHDFDPTDTLSEGYAAKHGFFHADGKTPVATEDLPLARAIRGDMPCDLQFLVRNDRTPEGKVVIATATPLQSEDGSLRGGVVVVRDISNIKRAEAALRESEERFRNTFVSSPVGMWVVGMDHRWIEVNPTLCEMVGRTEEEMLGMTFEAITHPLEELAAELAITAKLVAGEITHFQREKRYLHKRGYEVCCIIGVGLVRDGEGKPLYFVGHSFDITDRKAAEEKVKESLAEKEVLLREIHHRVKNNLQIISSLLQMQAQQSKDPSAGEMFRDSQNRIRSMALVHERLYRSDNLARVDFAAYVNGLVDDLLRSYWANGRVTIRTDIRGVQLPIDTAMPCGLAINELVSNCLKHAFPDGRKGEVRIELGPDGEGRALLCVRDDGVGLPIDVDGHHSESFGLRLIAALADQLGGSVEIDRRAGTTIRIGFPIRK